MVRFLADGRSCSAPEGATVLEACRLAGLSIPTLCHLDGVSRAESCRLCLVEVAGVPRRVPACATPVREGMEVTTSGPELLAYRRSVVEMLFAGGNHVCAVCPENGGCELQELCSALGLDHVRLGVPRRASAVDASHPRFALDPGRCVLCTRCLRVCAEVERAGSLCVVGRGRDAHVATDGGVAWARSRTCTSCGLCVDVCPTGALFEKSSAVQRTHRGATLLASSAPADTAREPPRRARLATVQLGGCAGCHMSLLDGGAAFLALARRADLVWSPLADATHCPEGVDLCLVEGAVTTEDDLETLQVARARSAVLVALGDCAGWGGVTALRDALGPREGEALARERTRTPGLPRLLDRVRPLGEVVAVDLHLPGCPPAADAILAAIADLLDGGAPRAGGTGRFG